MRLDELISVSDLAMRSKGHWGYSQDFLDACKDELTITQEEFSNPSFHFYVFEQDKTILGYYALFCQSKETYELDALFVEPSFIGKGIGKQLMQHAI